MRKGILYLEVVECFHLCFSFIIIICKDFLENESNQEKSYNIHKKVVNPRDVNFFNSS